MSSRPDFLSDAADRQEAADAERRSRRGRFGRRGRPPRERRGGRVVIVLLVVLVLLGAGAYVAAYYAASDRLPRGTTIGGVSVGGLTRGEAVTRLREELGGDSAPITVTAGPVTRLVSAQEAGLSVDYEESVAMAGARRSWEPQWLWDHYTGGDDLEPVVTVDDAAMTQAVTRLARSVDRPARDGRIRFGRGEVAVTRAVDGRAVDVDATREALTAAFLADEDSAQAQVELELTATAPDIDQADVQQALDSFANPAVSGPVTLRFADTPVRLRPRDYTGVLSMESRRGELVPVLDEAGLAGLVDRRTGDQDQPVDATVELVDGRPQVVPAQPGVAFAARDISGAFLKVVAAAPGARELQVMASVAQPDVTTAEARAWGIKEKVSTFTTFFPAATYRDINIGRAAELVDGTVLAPGEAFSLNDTTGERTAANGFVEGFVISDGVFKEEYGGGVSQMATTTFNAAFFAGLEDIEHKPHSFYISRYPMGREATLVFGVVDLQFRNDTPHGILIEADVVPSAGRAEGSVTVSMWSTKYWDITTTTSAPYDYTPPETRIIRDEECFANEGYDGFEVDVTRFFRRAGQDELVREENFHTVYVPSDTVICRPPAAG